MTPVCVLQNCPHISGLRAARAAGGWPPKRLPAGRCAGRSGRGGALTTPSLSPAHFSARRNPSKIRPKPLKIVGAAIVTLLRSRERTQRLTGANAGLLPALPASAAHGDAQRRSRPDRAGAGCAAPLCVKLNISYLEAFLCCPNKLGQFRPFGQSWLYLYLQRCKFRAAHRTLCHPFPCLLQ